MAKKKKKQKQQQQSVLSSPQPPAPSLITSTSGIFQTEDFVDRLEVRLAGNNKSTNGNSNKRSFASRFTPSVTFLSDADARRLRVFAGDFVFIITKHGNTVIESSSSLFSTSSSSLLSSNENPNSCSSYSCAICKVEISGASSTITSSNPVASPYTPTKSKTASFSSSSGASGTIQISPTSFCEFLFPEIPEQEQPPSTPRLRTPDPKLTTTTNAAAETTTTNSLTICSDTNKKATPFSFADFVEQQGISTPSTPRSPKKLPTKARHQAWLVPLEYKLGQKMIKAMRLTQASTIRMELPPNFVLADSCRSILEQLVRATHDKRWVQVGEPILTSFQGRTVELRAIGLETNTKTTDDPGVTAVPLEEAFDKLQITDADDHDKNDGDQEGAEILSIFLSLRLNLLQINRDTRVEFCSALSVESAKKDETTKQLRQVDVDDDVMFVAGLSSVVQHVREHLLIPLARPELFAHSHVNGSKNNVVQPPRGILLHGPSGVGKSCLAKQIARDMQQRGRSSKSPLCQVEFVNCVSLQSKTSIVGEAERALSRYFRPSPDPKLLILDDIHLICSRRGGSGGTTDQLAATLLAMMDGVGQRGRDGAPIAILAITNDPSSLDPALRRPGRLDYEVEVPLPDEPWQRAEILRFHLNKISTENSSSLNVISDDDLLNVAKNAKGFNGADCMLAVKEAVLFSIRRRGLSTTTVDISAADLANAVRSIRPSAIKAITVEIPQVKWSDIGGMDCVKENLREAIELPLAQDQLFEKLKIPPPRGILLYGPPGTGKTMIARALATEGKMNFLAVKGPELLSKWLGESERALASLFRRARMASPSIIFFDEIDAIATKRGSSDSTTGSRMLSQLLTELDGVVTTGSLVCRDKRKQRVIVIGATNRPDLLDNALTRPGRIDRMVYVGLPDRLTRVKVFEVALKTRACDSSVDLQRLADEDVSGGYSGAEIVGICREAALLALEVTGDGDIQEVGSGGFISPRIKMDHLFKVINLTKKQITQEMLALYTSFRQK